MVVGNLERGRAGERDMRVRYVTVLLKEREAPGNAGAASTRHLLPPGLLHLLQVGYAPKSEEKCAPSVPVEGVPVDKLRVQGV